MSADRFLGSRRDLRRALGWSLVAGLSIAALTAAVAVVDGSFDDTDWRVIGTSLGFAVFSATGAAGMSLRLRRPTPRLQLLGLATGIAAAVAFALLALALWFEFDDDTIWQWWGAAALIALGTSHASLVVGARATTDAAIVSLMSRVALATGAIDTTIAVLIVAEALEEGPAEGFALLVIALVLSTALTPILRRLTGLDEASGRRPAGAGDIAAELIEIAARVDLLAHSAGARGRDLRRHADGLRASAEEL
jgi:hypothetical protein